MKKSGDAVLPSPLGFFARLALSSQARVVSTFNSHVLHSDISTQIASSFRRDPIVFRYHGRVGDGRAASLGAYNVSIAFTGLTRLF
jgi:hypothetical protein